MAPLSQESTLATTGDAVVDQGAAGAAPWPIKGAGTAGTADAGVLTIQGIVGMTPIKVTPTAGISSATATPANVASSASSITLLASNANRLAWSVFNDSTSLAYINFGAVASASAFVIRVQPNSYYESTPSINYTGALNIIWASANGNARVCEFTA